AESAGTSQKKMTSSSSNQSGSMPRCRRSISQPPCSGCQENAWLLDFNHCFSTCSLPKRQRIVHSLLPLILFVVSVPQPLAHPLRWPSPVSAGLCASPLPAPTLVHHQSCHLPTPASAIQNPKKLYHRLASVLMELQIKLCI